MTIEDRLIDLVRVIQTMRRTVTASSVSVVASSWLVALTDLVDTGKIL